MITSRNRELLCKRCVCVCVGARGMCGIVVKVVWEIWFIFLFCFMEVPDCKWVSFVRGRAKCVTGSARVCISKNDNVFLRFMRK